MKKVYYSFLWNFLSIISLYAQKLALNKWMRPSDDEQGINKLRPKLLILIFTISNLFPWQEQKFLKLLHLETHFHHPRDRCYEVHMLQYVLIKKFNLWHDKRFLLQLVDTATKARKMSFFFKKKLLKLQSYSLNRRVKTLSHCFLSLHYSFSYIGKTKITRRAIISH